MSFDEAHVHDGHRARMRAKLIEHGPRIFDTYELLEMLLYYVVPYRDTNPIAKRLLVEFGSLDGVLGASVPELARISGVGERCAQFIHDAGRVMKVGELSVGMRPVAVFDSRDLVGKFFVDYFDEEEDFNIAVMLLDDSMRMLCVRGIPGKRFGSGAVQAHPFIDVALSSGATVAIVAYTHRNGIPYPLDGDFATTEFIAAELKKVGVMLADQYIVGGGKYTAIGASLKLASPPTVAMQHYLGSKCGGAV